MRRSNKHFALWAPALIAACLTTACTHSRRLAPLGYGATDARRAFTPPAAIADWQSLGSTTEAELRLKYPTNFENAPQVTVSQAQGMDRIQNSWLLLDAEELWLLNRNGFGISERDPEFSFALGYQEIFKADLPVYITADAILHAWHRAYDGLLIEIEQNILYPLLDELLTELRQALRVSDADPVLRRELDAYLTIAHSLLSDKPLTPEAGGSPERVAAACDLAWGSPVTKKVEFFGSEREV